MQMPIPGPYRARSYGGRWWVEGKGKREVCDVQQGESEAENEAIAKRIARAMNALDVAEKAIA